METKDQETISKGKEVVVQNPDWKTVQDITIPEIMFHPYKTGIGDLDHFMSEMGGIVPSQSIYFTGEPGIGKTTLSMFILSKLSEQVGKKIKPKYMENGDKINRTIPDRHPAIISLEMSDFQLKMQTRRISGLENILITTKMGPTEADVKKKLNELEQINPSILVLDSVQKWARMSNSKMLLITEMFTAWAKKTLTPVILIGHCNKDGSFKGPSGLTHEVDTHIHLRRDDIQEAWISMTKTRFGGMADSIPWEIKPYGLKVGYQVYTGSGEGRDEGEIHKEQIEKIGCPVPSIIEFKAQDWDEERMKTAMTDLFNYLVTKYKKELNDKLDTDLLTIKFKNVNHTCCRTTEIQIGLKMMRSWAGGQKSIYRGEDSYIQKWGKTKQDVGLWIMFHEFCHLFKGMKHHKKSFFAHLGAMAKKEEWMFHDWKMEDLENLNIKAKA